MQSNIFNKDFPKLSSTGSTAPVPAARRGQILRQFLICATSAAFLLMPTHSVESQTKKQLTVHEIYGTTLFLGKSLRGIHWMKSGDRFSFLKTDTARKLTSIWLYDARSGEEKMIVDAKNLLLKEEKEPFHIINYDWSPSEQQILFTETLPARGVKSGGNFYLYDLRTKEFRQLTSTKEPQSIIQFSPDGNYISFVRSNNLFILDLRNGTETQLTHDGSDVIINGKFDWVYEEEFGIINGYEWSPDSKRIAFWRLDVSHEPIYTITDFMPLHLSLEQQRYPNPGDSNAVVRIGVVWVATGEVRWMDIGENTDIYIPRIKWTPDSRYLSIQRLNRAQNKLELLFADPTTGRSTVVLTEIDSAWVSVRNDLTFLKKKNLFLWSSERSGFLHLYVFKYRGSRLLSGRQITHGDWEVSDLLGIDEKHQRVYFTSTKNSPLERQLYSIKLDGSDLQQISSDPGIHRPTFSPTFAYYLDNFSNVQTPPQLRLHKASGELVRIIEENKMPELENYAMGHHQFLSFFTSDSVQLNAWMITPVDLDSTKKYPVLVYVYGGPGSQTVLNAWGGQSYLWYQMLAEKGYIVFSVDGRGTGGRGRAFEKIVYRQLGKWEVHDQIEAAKYLASLPFVDKNRIGIWGWSYGGYMASLSLLVGADYFQAAVAVAPVTDWRLYDSIYTERYMGMPGDNPDGYKESAPLNHAEKLKGKLLVIHGTSDDNVHWQNTIQFVAALQKQNKQLSTMFYPNKDHGIYGGNTRENLFTLITDFIVENL